MKKLRLIIILLIACLSLILVAAPAEALNPLSGACSGEATNSEICNTATDQLRNGTNPISGSDGIIAKASRALALIVGIASVIVIVVGGLNYVAASGNPEKTARAKARITYAVVGIVIALLAWAITAFFSKRLL